MTDAMSNEQRMKSRNVVMLELMRMLPPEGSEFPTQDRIRWLYAVGYVLMAYHGTSGELRITEEKK